MVGPPGSADLADPVGADYVIVNRHAWLGGVGSRCTVCGSIRRDASAEGTPLGCIARLTSERADAGGRRVVSCEDFDIIGARLTELRAERDSILQQPSSD
jgi:hypothetical protein